MNRTFVPLKDLLLSYKPFYEQEKIHQQEMIEFLTMESDCFQRKSLHRHFTSSAWIVSEDSTKFLLLHHRKLNEWIQVGGHCDGDPDVLKVALKEAQEESGLKNLRLLWENIFHLDIHHVPHLGSTPQHLHYDICFIFQAYDDHTLIKNDESYDVRWFSKDEPFPSHNSSVQNLYHKWCCHFLSD